MSFMKTSSAIQLNTLTSEFYARNASSFSATRNSAWKGWNTCVDVIHDTFPGNLRLRVLDIGCGNLRFKRFLNDYLGRPFDYWGIDNSSELSAHGTQDTVQHLDVITPLLANHRLADAIDAPQCDIVCAFGLMHHIPGASNRMGFLDAMLEKTAPGGIIAFSLWQFMKDKRLARKALQVTEQALRKYPELELEENEWLMGWQDSAEFLRYCHSFADGDSEALIEHMNGKATLIADYEADGKPGNLNRYLMFKV